MRRCRVDSGDAVGDETCQGPAFIGPRATADVQGPLGRQHVIDGRAAAPRMAAGRCVEIPLTAPAKVSDDCERTTRETPRSLSLALSLFRPYCVTAGRTDHCACDSAAPRPSVWTAAPSAGRRFIYVAASAAQQRIIARPNKHMLSPLPPPVANYTTAAAVDHTAPFSSRRKHGCAASTRGEGGRKRQRERHRERQREKGERRAKGGERRHRRDTRQPLPPLPPPPPPSRQHASPPTRSPARSPLPPLHHHYHDTHLLSGQR